MSFYTYANAYTSADCPSPGPAQNVTDGLCERACVQVKRVYDSCMQQVQLDDVIFDLTDIKPDDRSFTAPLTFLSCRSIPGKTRITDLSVHPIADSDHLARVRATLSIPIQILFSDANGLEGMGNSFVTMQKDVVLYVPDESIIPYSVEALAAAVCVTGAYCGNFRFRVTICVTAILKVVAEVQLLIPTYGYCRIPPCQEFASGVCDDFFSLPLYPPIEGCECVGTANTQ